MDGLVLCLSHRVQTGACERKAEKHKVMRWRQCGHSASREWQAGQLRVSRRSVRMHEHEWSLKTGLACTAHRVSGLLTSLTSAPTPLPRFNQGPIPDPRPSHRRQGHRVLHIPEGEGGLGEGDGGALLVHLSHLGGVGDALAGAHEEGAAGADGPAAGRGVREGEAGRVDSRIQSVEGG